MPNGPHQRFPFPGSSRRVGFLSTYPPKLCGLATFAAALEAALVRAGDRVDVVRVDDGAPFEEPLRPTRGVLRNGLPGSGSAASATLSTCDVAIIQHEYGIYGGVDGDEILGVLSELRVPAIVVLHTVPLTPTPHQRAVLELICELAGRVVVMSGAAWTRLTSSYAVDPAKAVTIAHGAAVPPEHHVQRGRNGHTASPQLLTWGLLGPGKGIEHAISAMSLLRDLRPQIRYTVAGVTHPKVFARDGDAYRESLVRHSWSSDVAGSVSFDDTYRDVETLTRYVASASLVVLPYDSRDQVTSGVLVDALAAGRPVIATAFPHAVELLADGAGIVVPHADPVALAEAIRSVVTDPVRRDAMAAQARRLAPSLRWSAVAARYRTLCDDLTSEKGALAS